MRFAIALCLAAAAAVAADQTAAQKEIAAATEQFRTAMVKGDAAALGRIFHPDLTYEHSSALTQNKAEAIAAVVKPDGAPKAIDFHDATTRVYGNTALFKARADYTNGKGEVSHLDVLMVWIKTGGTWQLVGRQSTKVQ
jgi:hypothetical protein